MKKQTKVKFSKQGIVASLLTATIILSNTLPYTNVYAAEDTSNNDIIVTSIDTHSEDVIEGQYLIVFKEGVSIEEMKIEVAKYKGKIVKDYFDLNMITASFTKSDYNHFIENTEIVSVIEPNLEFEQIGQSRQYAHNLTNVESAWNSQFTGKGIDIAVIDSGISTNHEDLNVVGGVSMVDYTSSYNDDEGHGTHVAGIIASLKNNIGTVGIAYDANLYAVKVLNEQGEAQLPDVIAGIQWAIAQNVDIINLSLGTDQYSRTLHDVVKQATDQGIFVVVASGNDGEKNVSYPAKFPESIAVGAIDNNKNLANFSNYGSEIDIVAPGVDIASTYLSGYAYGEGTSMAAPHVSALLALYKNAYPNLSNAEIEQMLYANAEDLGETGFDDYYGHGLARFSQLIPPTEIEEPVIEETPPTEIEEPVIEETPPTEIEEPVIEETPPTEVETPVIEETPPTEVETPVIEETPPTEVEEPVIEETPPTEVEEPVIEETPPTEVEEPVIEETPPTEVETPVTIENVVTLPSGSVVSLDKTTRKLEWEGLNARRYQVSYEKITTNEKKVTLTSLAYYDLDRFKLENNQEYQLTITPYIGTKYSAELALTVSLTTADGQYIISSLDADNHNEIDNDTDNTIEQQPDTDNAIEQQPEPIVQPELTNPLFELQNGITFNAETGELTWQSVQNARRYRIQLSAPTETTKTTLVMNTQYSLSRWSLKEEKEYIVSIIPYVNGLYNENLAVKFKINKTKGTFVVSEL